MLKLLVYKFGKLFFYNSNKTKSKKSMSALQKKRDEFRRKIRRNYLDKFFQERRKQFKECQVNFQVLAQVDQIFSELESQLISKRKSYNYEYSTNFVNISKCFQKLKSIAPYDYEKVFTKYMTQKKASQRIIALLNDLIQNQVSSDEEQSNQYEEKLKYATSVRDYTIVEILKFFDTLTLTIIEPDTLLAVIDSVFNLFTDDVLWDSNDTFACLRYTLSILSKLLEDSKNEKIFDHFSNKGIGNQIMKLIDRIKKIELPLQVHNNLLQVINNYLACCLAFSQTNSSKVGQVTIQTSEVNQKEFILFYCVYFIDKRQSSLYPTVFSCISKLLEIHEFLINSLKDEYLALVCDLIVDEKRDTQVESLILLNDLTYHSQTCIDVLLKDGYLLNMLNKRLLLQKNTQDKHVAPSVQKIAYIICNCLLTQKPKLKKLCLQHYIWEEIFESFHPSKKLFPLIMTMAYFLEANGHKNFQKYFRPFAETIRNFDWETCSYSESIREAIMRTFYNAQQWQEHQYVQFLRILNDEGLLKMVEDLVDPDELSKIKGISIQ